MSAFQVAKLWGVEHIGLARDALHIYVAMAVFLGSAALFGWRIAGWRPIMLVIAAAVLGEVWDIRDRIAIGWPQRWGGNVHDIVNTVFWPAVLWATARWSKVLRR